MENNVHTFQLNINWTLLSLISSIDRFDATWNTIEQREGQTLKQLKSIATVKSVGASTRIEGSKMSNKEVEVLLNNIDITKIEDRDSQEVFGYFKTLDLISESYKDIGISENSIKNLHNILMEYNEKDKWHKGDYKQHSNAVEATHPDGTKHIIFQTTEAGYPTEDAMRNLIAWYKKDNETHPLVKCALFAYDFVSIHPFQDGNGRLSRLISSFLLLQTGYKWIQYVSFENEIESRKVEYYRVLQNCQANRPNENVDEWINFFFDSLKNIQLKLSEKLKIQGVETSLTPKEKSVVSFIENYPGCKSGDIAKKLGIPSPTIKRILPKLIQLNLITKYGVGPGTNYTIK